MAKGKKQRVDIHHHWCDQISNAHAWIRMTHLKLRLIQLLDCLIRARCHGHKSKAAWPARLAILGDEGIVHFTKLTEQTLKVFPGGVPGNVTYNSPGHHSSSVGIESICKSCLGIATDDVDPTLQDCEPRQDCFWYNM